MVVVWEGGELNDSDNGSDSMHWAGSIRLGSLVDINYLTVANQATGTAQWSDPP